MTQPDEIRKLLIVDDEEKVCQTLGQYFRLKGYEVLAVHDGPEALALAPAFHPDTVILDLLMPGMSGVETLKSLKELEPAARVIMLSGADHEEVAKGALKLGADFYVCKPANLGELERLVSGIVRVRT